jgi:hypothetical protein
LQAGQVAGRSHTYFRPCSNIFLRTTETKAIIFSNFFVGSHWTRLFGAVKFGKNFIAHFFVIKKGRQKETNKSANMIKLSSYSKK